MGSRSPWGALLALLASAHDARSGDPAAGDVVSMLQQSRGSSLRRLPDRQCPTGYAAVVGDVPGWDQFGRNMENLKATIDLCAEDCNARPDCLSFEWSTRTNICSLNKVEGPVLGSFEDYTFCQRRFEDAAQQYIAENQGVQASSEVDAEQVQALVMKDVPSKERKEADSQHLELGRVRLDNDEPAKRGTAAEEQAEEASRQVTSGMGTEQQQGQGGAGPNADHGRAAQNPEEEGQAGHPSTLASAGSPAVEQEYSGEAAVVEQEEVRLAKAEHVAATAKVEYGRRSAAGEEKTELRVAEDQQEEVRHKAARKQAGQSKPEVIGQEAEHVVVEAVVDQQEIKGQLETHLLSNYEDHGLKLPLEAAEAQKPAAQGNATKHGQETGMGPDDEQEDIENRPLEEAVEKGVVNEELDQSKRWTTEDKHETAQSTAGEDRQQLTQHEATTHLQVDAYRAEAEPMGGDKGQVAGDRSSAEKGFEVAYPKGAPGEHANTSAMAAEQHWGDAKQSMVKGEQEKVGHQLAGQGHEELEHEAVGNQPEEGVVRTGSKRYDEAEHIAANSGPDTQQSTAAADEEAELKHLEVHTGSESSDEAGRIAANSGPDAQQSTAAAGGEAEPQRGATADGHQTAHGTAFHEAPEEAGAKNITEKAMPASENVTQISTELEERQASDVWSPWQAESDLKRRADEAATRLTLEMRAKVKEALRAYSQRGLISQNQQDDVLHTLSEEMWQKAEADFLRSAVNEEMSTVCPEGYKAVTGDVPGWDQFGRDRSNLMGSLGLCSEDCTARPNCLSFEWSPTSHICSLNRVTSPTSGGFEDYVFCSRREAAAVDAMRRPAHKERPLSAGEEVKQTIQERRGASEEGVKRQRPEAVGERAQTKVDGEEGTTGAEHSPRVTGMERERDWLEAGVSLMAGHQAPPRIDPREAARRRMEEDMAKRRAVRAAQRQEALMVKKKAREDALKHSVEEAARKKEEMARIRQEEQRAEEEARKKAEEEQLRLKEVEKQQRTSQEEAEKRQRKLQEEAEKRRFMLQQEAQKQEDLKQEREKAEREKKKQAEKQAELDRFQSLWAPGQYRILLDDVPVTATAGRSRMTIAHVSAGTVVDVLEVPQAAVDGRVRARIKNPAGWISLFHQGSQIRFAEKME